MTAEQNPQERLEYQGDMRPVFERAAAAYGLGQLIDFNVVPIGYEDYNARLQTDRGAYFAKVFAADRNPYDIARYADIMSAVMVAGVSHPRLYERGSELVYQDAEAPASMVIMDFIEGQTLYDARRSPTDAELSEILRQAAIINHMAIRPPYIYDSWAVTNLGETFDPVKRFLNTADRQLVDQAIAELNAIDHEELPHCFVHGDIIKSNVILGADGKIYILDFSVSNWYPRIQELAVIAGNLMNKASEEKPFIEILKHLVTEYVAQGGELTESEVTALPTFVRAAYAAEFVGAADQKYLQDNKCSEKEYWMALGRAVLIHSLL